MPLTSKRLLSTLSAMSAVSLTAASVVACAYNTNRLATIERSTDELVRTYQYPVQSWNTAWTFYSTDFDVLANTNATSLGVDEYGRVYGDIFAPNSDLKASTVGTTQDQKKWTYKIRENLHWYKNDGSLAGDITSLDYENAAEFIMRSSQTGSNLVSLWSDFIVGATELNLYLTHNKTVTFAEAKDKIKSDWQYTETIDGKEVLRKVAGVSEGFGLDTSKEGYITYNLKKPASYFESLLCYAVFAPMFVPKGEVVAEVDKREDISKGYYSGAYLPKINDGNQIVLERNQNYWFNDMVTINKIKYLNTSNATSSKDRELFEAGDTSGFMVNNDDAVGWNRYIGSDIDNPIFNYLYDVPTTESLSSYVLYFNTYNSDIDSGKTQNDKDRAVKASKLLQNKLARAFMSTSIDRSVFAKFYSEKFDGNSTVSKMIRNVYTAPGVAVDDSGKDYSKYVEQAVNSLENVSSSGKKLSLDDGNDALLGNSELFLGKNQNQENLIKEIKQYMLDENLISQQDSKLDLRVLVNPEESKTVVPKIINMFDRFNEITDNPIHISIVAASTKEDYQTLRSEGRFDLMTGGWAPDYADPAAFLNSYRIDGDLSTYTGSEKIIPALQSQKSQLYANANNTSKSYVESYKSFDEGIAKVDSTITAANQKVKRFEEFAKLESSYLYENFFVMPFYIKNAPKNYNISYVIPYTSNYAWSYGIAAYKDWSKVLNKTIISKEMAEEQRKRVEAYKISLSSENNFKKDDQNDRNHILFK
ncbi:oligopeptide ABC transporter substrate-binding protein [Spiroplasma helicoides]|uniref:Oligopeptide ABC transporter substrate-binding protein n=1 Tax=Spiroplasma helicoides TaxID=216938 RepID=A0A1B3SLQ1_9MOLU|nr:ABC transporter substrate-binding protein [Spiroplasma helicoides]AOG60866.1 oligopeptide ABC transporter substrate-binding protein [Spiroplasma helicoides]